MIIKSFINLGSCPNPDWSEDLYCDDVTNNEMCDWDGGACCLPEIKDSYCELCICHIDGTRHPSEHDQPGNGISNYILCQKYL